MREVGVILGVVVGGGNVEVVRCLLRKAPKRSLPPLRDWALAVYSNFKLFNDLQSARN